MQKLTHLHIYLWTNGPCLQSLGSRSGVNLHHPLPKPWQLAGNTNHSWDWALSILGPSHHPPPRTLWETQHIFYRLIILLPLRGQAYRILCNGHNGVERSKVGFSEIFCELPPPQSKVGWAYRPSRLSPITYSLSSHRAVIRCRGEDGGVALHHCGNLAVGQHFSLLYIWGFTWTHEFVFRMGKKNDRPIGRATFTLISINGALCHKTCFCRPFFSNFILKM